MPDLGDDIHPFPRKDEHPQEAEKEHRQNCAMQENSVSRCDENHKTYQKDNI
jgi:hypothetical protein